MSGFGFAFVERLLSVCRNADGTKGLEGFASAVWDPRLRI